ncbi:hypothetical protein BVI1335_1750010 [Burkholderia vietnamiensis]|nr:hypothetical protein BVI1335_1750010 [Burkholderia vietnamiensis]
MATGKYKVLNDFQGATSVHPRMRRVGAPPHERRRRTRDPSPVGPAASAARPNPRIPPKTGLNRVK